MSGILRLESLTKGNTLKQGDLTLLKYRLFDADGDKLDISGKPVTVRLMKNDFTFIAYEKEGLAVASDDTISFNINKILPGGLYHLEVIVDDKYIFPSRADEGKFNVDKSSLGAEITIIENAGIDAVVRKAVDLINEDPSLIIDEDKLISEIIANTSVGSIEEYYQEYRDAIEEYADLKPKALTAISKSDEALTKSQNALNVANGIDAKATNALNLSESADTLSKSVQEQFNQVVIDGDSSVEAAQARVDASGQTNPTLKARLDKEHNEVTAQLAQKVTRGQGEVTSADLSQEVKEQMTGGSVAVVGDNTVLETNIVDKNVSYKKLKDYFLTDTTTNNLDSTVDLNTITRNGAYYVVRAINSPPDFGNRAMLFVYGYDLFCAQTMVDLTGKYAYRFKSASAWMDWQTAQNVKDVIATDKVVTSSLKDKSVSFSKLVDNPLYSENTNALGLNTDLNLITKTGVYLCTATTLNSPSGSNKVGLVHVLAISDGYGSQIYHDITNRSWSRINKMNDGGGFTDWKEINLISDTNKGSKTVVAFGDSITGAYSGIDSTRDYPLKIQEKTGWKVYNVGFGGTRMGQHPTPRYDAYSMYRLADAVTTGDYSLQDADTTGAENYASQLTKLKSIDFNNVDIVTIAYGTNDWGGGHTPNPPIDNPENRYDTSNLVGATRYSVKTLQEAYPHLRIVLLTPFYRYDSATNTDADEGFRPLNNPNYHINEYVDAEITVAKELKIPVLDMYYALGMGKHNRSQYFISTDGVHPNANGMDLIASRVAGQLKALYY